MPRARLAAIAVLTLNGVTTTGAGSQQPMWTGHTSVSPSGIPRLSGAAPMSIDTHLMAIDSAAGVFFTTDEVKLRVAL